MLGDKADLVRWVRRYDAAERSADDERRAHPLTPSESFNRALELMRLARDHRVADFEGGEIPAEDLLAYRAWNRIRQKLLAPHG